MTESDNRLSHGPNHKEREDIARTDNAAPSAIEGDSEAQTWFNPKEGDDYYKYDDMAQVNHGRVHNSDYPNRKNEYDTTRDIDILAGQIGTTDYQQDRCHHIIDNDIDALNDIGTWDRRVVIFALLTLIVNKDNRHIQDEDVYGDLIDDIDTSRSAIHDARDRLRKFVSL